VKRSEPGVVPLVRVRTLAELSAYGSNLTVQRSVPQGSPSVLVDSGPRFSLRPPGHHTFA
jgi:hypothetical protein